MSSSRFSSHLLTRKWYFLFPHFSSSIQPDFVLVDTLRQQSWDWYTPEEQRAGFEALLRNGSYRLLEAKDGVFLFQRTRVKD
jgi:hypothetical protein